MDRAAQEVAAAAYLRTLLPPGYPATLTFRAVVNPASTDGRRTAVAPEASVCGTMRTATGETATTLVVFRPEHPTTVLDGWIGQHDLPFVETRCRRLYAPAPGSTEAVVGKVP